MGGQLPCSKKDLASEAKLRTMNYSCSSYLCRYPFTSPTSLRWTEGAVDSEKRCRTGRAQTEVPPVGHPTQPSSQNDVPWSNRNPPLQLALQQVLKKHKHCQWTNSTASKIAFRAGSCPEWTFGQLPCSITTLKTIFCIYSHINTFQYEAKVL